MPPGKKRPSSLAFPVPTISALMALACSRKRERLHTLTTFTHANLEEFLAASLGHGWRVVGPPPAGVSSFPQAAGEDPTPEMGFLSTFLKCSVEDALDTWNGHCETCAVFCTQRVLDLCESTPNPHIHAYEGAVKELSSMGFEASATLLFEAEKRARESGSEQKTLPMWGPLSPPVKKWGEDGGKGLIDWTAGAPGFSVRLQGIGAEAAAQGGTMTSLPCYVLNYIYDGDELEEEDMALPIETALFSLHVVGLVLDGRAKVCYICDPNGQLIPGGNMEFVHIPVTLREGPPTTAVSAFDVAQRKKAPSSSKGSKKSGGKKA